MTDQHHQRQKKSDISVKNVHNSSPEYHIGIVGCGKMGKDLFNWLTGFPFAVTMICRTEEQAEKLKDIFDKKQNRALKYGVEDEDTISFRKTHTVITSQLEKLAECDLVLETITEDEERKRALFLKLEQILPENCVLASNTSSIDPDKLFSGLANEKNCLGLHFFFPVAIKSTVEINIGEKTGDRTVAKAEEFLKRTGRFYLKLTGKNHFIINRMFLKMQAGCCRLPEEENMEVPEIDAIIKTHLFPTGVFEFFDYVGNDVMLQSVKNYMAYETDTDFYRPMIKMLEQKVKEKKLGKKVSAGFYTYPVKTISGETELSRQTQRVLQQIISWYLEGIFEVLKRNICCRNELENIVREYLNTDKSPFKLAEKVGFA